MLNSEYPTYYKDATIGLQVIYARLSDSYVRPLTGTNSEMGGKMYTADLDIKAFLNDFSFENFDIDRPRNMGQQQGYYNRWKNIYKIFTDGNYYSEIELQLTEFLPTYAYMEKFIDLLEQLHIQFVNEINNYAETYDEMLHRTIGIYADEDTL